MSDCVNAVEDGFRQLALGNVDMPLRPTIRMQKHSATVLIMPAYVAGMETIGVKLVSIYPDNPSKHGLPTTLATIMLNDPRNGTPLAIMDGTYITAMRTGAASGVATKYLARDDAGVAGIIGSGVQARTQLTAICSVRKIIRAKVYSPSREHASKFAEEMSRKLGLDVKVAGDSKEVVRGSDVIATASTSKEPVFKGSWLEEGVHINGVGSHSPNARELDETAIKRSKVVVDSMDAALREAGDIMIPLSQNIISKEHLYAELGEVITGKKPGRTSGEEITLFKSQGLAVQDIATALVVYNRAAKEKMGREVPL